MQDPPTRSAARPALELPLAWCATRLGAELLLGSGWKSMASPAPDKERVRREDHALARAVVRGEPESLALLAQRLRSVCRMLAHLDNRAGGLLDDHELADVTQDVIVIVWRKLPQFEGLSTLESWFYGICVLELRNAVRRSLRRRAGAADEKSLEQAPAPQESDDEHEDVHRALLRIGRDEARIIRLKHFEELTFDEIGARLEASPNTIKARYYRGLEELKAVLEGGVEST